MCIPEGGIPAFVYLGLCNMMCMLTWSSIKGINVMDASTTWSGIAMVLFGYLVILYLDWSANSQP